MHSMACIRTTAHGPPRPWAALGVIALLAAACADDTTAGTDTAQGTTTETTDGPTVTTDSPTTTPVPTTTEEPPTTSVTGTDSTTAVDPTIGPTTDTTDTTTTTTTTTTTDTTDTTDTDSTTGDPLVGRSITQTVNSGTVAASPNFRMVFTLGQPTQNQGVYTSSNFRLQGGLIGANGNPP